MEKTKVDLKELSSTVISLFPGFNKEEQQVAVNVYRLLAKGQPVSVEMIAQEMTLPDDTVIKILNGFTGVDYDEGRIIGFWGLALPEMEHHFFVEGRTLYTWCAWDTLFIPQIIQKTADVESTCPVTGDKIRLKVTPERVEQINPAGAVMSFITPETAKIREDVVLHFCHYVHFFSSLEAGQKWTTENEGTFILSIDDAYTFGTEMNKVRYKEVIT